MVQILMRIESDEMKISGLICRNFNKGFSRADADMELNDYFINQGKVVISDVDTRSLVKYIRDKGAMNAIISSETLEYRRIKIKVGRSSIYGRIRVIFFCINKRVLSCRR